MHGILGKMLERAIHQAVHHVGMHVVHTMSDSSRREAAFREVRDSIEEHKKNRRERKLEELDRQMFDIELRRQELLRDNESKP